MEIKNSLTVLSLFGLLFLFSSLSCEEKAADVSCDDFTEDNQLYGKILDNIEFVGGSTTILINRETRSHDLSHVKNAAKRRFTDIDTTLFKIYEEMNTSSEELKCIPSTSKEAVFFEDGYDGSWEDSHVYGVISFSRIAYNSSKNQAIIYVEDFGAPLSAIAYLAYFKYQTDEWVLVGSELVWIS